MFEFFGRKKIYLKVQIVILCLFLIDIGSYIAMGKVTQGKVVKYVNRGSGGYRYPSIRYPVIKFETRGKFYEFNGNLDAEYGSGSEVKVIYKPWRPKKAKVYTFWGMGKRPLIAFTVCSLIWLMIYSSFKPSATKKSRYGSYGHPKNPFV